MYCCKEMVKILKCYLIQKKSYGTLSKDAIFFGQPCIIVYILLGKSKLGILLKEFILTYCSVEMKSLPTVKSNETTDSLTLDNEYRVVKTVISNSIAIATQLVKRGKYEGAKRESSRLVSQIVPRKAKPLHLANVFGDFTTRKFVAAFQHLKPGKAPDPDSYLFGVCNP